VCEIERPGRKGFAGGRKLGGWVVGGGSKVRLEKEVQDLSAGKQQREVGLEERRRWC